MTTQSQTAATAPSRAFNLKHYLESGVVLHSEEPDLGPHTPYKAPSKTLFPDTTRHKTLYRRTKYQILITKSGFLYLPMGALEPKGEHLLTPKGKSFALLRDSLVIYDKEVYWVTSKDAERGIVRRSRKLNTKRGTITYDEFISGNFKPLPSNSTKPFSSSISSGEGQPSSVDASDVEGTATSNQAVSSAARFKATLAGSADELGTIPGLTVDELKAIDLAGKEQRAALFGGSDPESWQEQEWSEEDEEDS